MPSSRHSDRVDLVLVGGGLVGACLAEELAHGGARVVVLDAGDRPGHATGRAAGVAVPSLRYATDETFHPWLTLARSALVDDIARLEPIHGRFSLAQPVLRLLLPQDVEALPEGPARQAAGVPASDAELAQLAPGLQVRGDEQPYLLPDGLSVNGPAYLQAAQAAALRAGVTWSQGRQVVSLDETADGVVVHCADGTAVSADRVVVTAGAWTGTLTGLPIRPQRGQLVLLEAPEVTLGCIVSGRLYVAPLPNGGLLVGATEEEAGFDERCTAGSVAGVLAYALRRFPGLASATVVEPRAGLRPVSDTGRPIVGRVPGRQRVYLAAGHAGHGLISARATARGAVAGLLHGDWDQVPDDFCPRAAAPVTAAAAGRAS
ncbi:MAG TPA: FAD-dependent oxidoreductase [Kineosporiaceae bacterium]